MCLVQTFLAARQRSHLKGSPIQTLPSAFTERIQGSCKMSTDEEEVGIRDSSQTPSPVGQEHSRQSVGGADTDVAY